MHPLLQLVAREFDRCGVRWLLLRSDAELHTPTGDVDVLVHPSDASIAGGVLSASGFVWLPAWGYGKDRFLLAYDPSTGQWVWLHVAYDLHFGSWGTARTNEAVGVLERRVRSDNVFVPAPGDQFWALLLHCLLDKRRVKPGHRKTLRALVEHARADSPLAHVFEAVAPEGRGSQWALAQVAAGAWPAVEQCAWELAQSMPSDRGLLSRRTVITRVLRQLSRVRDLRRRGMCVALMGPDGAGKSTLSRGIQEEFFFPSRLVYMGVGVGRIARLAQVLGAFRFRGHALLGRPPFTYGAYVGTLWLRYLTGLTYRQGGRVVVFDRYSYDAWLPMPAPISWIKAQALRLQARAVPAPDLVLVLDVPGEVMFRRKGEFDPVHLERQRQHLLGLVSRIPDLEIVDATRPADVVRRDVIERIWRRYQRRWER